MGGTVTIVQRVSTGGRVVKKKIAAMILAATMAFSLVGCGSIENELASGGVFSTKANYVVINYSGGEIFDVWTLENAYVENSSSSDGYQFTDDTGNYVTVSGDVLVIRCNNMDTFKQYEEYHKYSN